MPLFGDIAKQVREYLATRDDDCAELIHGQKGRLCVFTVERIFALTAKEAKVSLADRQSVHCLRHSIAVFDRGTGASSAMEQLVSELNQHHAEFAKRVVGSVVVDQEHLTRNSLLAKARDSYAELAK